jgi:hypothetical protein
LLPYVLIILVLPFETDKLIVLFTSFVLGVVIDYFYNSSGLHASACTITGFARYYILKYVTPRDGYDSGVKPNLNDMGLEWFIKYAGTLILIHHFTLFYLEIFRFSEFFKTLLRIVLSSIGSFSLIYLIQFLTYDNSKRT